MRSIQRALVIARSLTVAGERHPARGHFPTTSQEITGHCGLPEERRVVELLTDSMIVDLLQKVWENGGIQISETATLMCAAWQSVSSPTSSSLKSHKRIYGLRVF